MKKIVGSLWVPQAEIYLAYLFLELFKIKYYSKIKILTAFQLRCKFTVPVSLGLKFIKQGAINTINCGKLSVPQEWIYYYMDVTPDFHVF